MEQRTLPDLPECLICRVDWRYRNFAGVGWWPLLEEMHQRLLAVDPGYRLDQVKEKFGLLRVYPNDERYRDKPELETRLEAVINEFVARSGRVCEKCGRPGRLRNRPEEQRRLRWIFTLCDDCSPEMSGPLWRLPRPLLLERLTRGEGHLGDPSRN